MKISIVTLSFNQGRFLESAIRSVVDQQGVDLDYVVVDPGSTDDSRSIIERYRPQLSHTVFERDDGPADGLNRGFAHASGEIYGFLNADDILRPGALAKVAQAFEHSPDADIISGNGHIIDADGAPIRRMYSDRYSVWGYLYGGVVLLQQSTFFRASAFEAAGGFNVDNRTCWDGELWLDMALAGKHFQRAGGFWSGFRVHGGSITSGIHGNDAQRRAYERDRRRMFLKARGRLPGGIKDKGQRVAARVVKWGSNPVALSARLASLVSPKVRRSPI
ncbi:MAG: glycosyltransferase [Alphaproteobacteria bacterium]|nr:glycosyltransferase [Alphaproteobacteria bacterium]